MTTATMTFSRTDLTRRTREILDLVRRGRPALIQSYGEQQAVVLDPLNYRLLRDLAGMASGAGGGSETQGLLRRYLAGEVSLSKIAETLGVSRFELMERFGQLGLPLQLGAADPRDAAEEVEAARGEV